MKKIIIIVCLSFCNFYLLAQDAATISQIRELEQKEVKAILNKDTSTLRALWDQHYVVHNPEGKIVLATPNPFDRPVLQSQRTSFTREVEQVVLQTDIAISMGRELVITTDEVTKTEKKIERRYTNIWKKKGDSWQLIARHANKICQ